uniref:HMMR_C domain-containing protein n=2 Tax=Macrostomum lignano TaxID=282301 RepID=A0A1I8H299_9PLAT
EIQRLEAALAEADSKLSATSESAASAATSAEQRANDAIKLAEKRANDAIKLAEKRAADAEQRAARAESSLAELQRRQTAAAEAEKRQLLSRCREAERLAAEREQSVREMDVRLSRAVAEAESHSREARSAKDRLTAVEAEKNRLLESANSTTNETERRLVEERRRVAGFEQAQSAAKEMLADLQEQVAVLKDQLKSAQAQLDRRQQAAAADTAAQLSELRSAVSSERKRAAKSESEAERLLQRLRQTESELDSAERRHQEAREEWQTRAYQLEQTCAQQLKLIDYLRPFEEQLNNCRCRAKKVVRVLGQWNSAALSTPQRTSASTVAAPQDGATMSVQKQQHQQAVGSWPSSNKYSFVTPKSKP